MRRGHRAAAAALLVAALAACASSPSSDGARLIAQGRFDEGLALMERDAKDHPRDIELYTSYLVQRNAVATALLREADQLRVAGDFDGAQAGYQSVLRIHPGSDSARAGMAAVDRLRRLQGQAREAQAALRSGDTAGAERIARSVLAQDATQREAKAVMRAVNEQRGDQDVLPSRLKEALQRQISLDLRDVPLGAILDIISRTGNINFIIDREVKTDARTSVFVHDTSLEDVIRILLLTNQLERKVLNGNSLLIYPATQPKQREYQDLVVRTFYLANADAKQTAAMIKAMVKTKDLYVDDKLNLVIMRDTPDAVRLAEKLVASQDVGEPEVVLDLEVLEVSSTLVKDLGIQYPTQISVNGGIGSDGTIPTQVQLPIKGGLHAFVANPVLLLNLSKQDGSTNILANPRIRVKNREKAKVHVGEKVPVITTTSTANVGVSSSVSYLETGLKLDVEPNVFLEDEVAIKVQLEVSNILETLNLSGTVAYRLGTRNAATTLRLHDGETQVLAGLIDNEDRKSFNGVPGVSELPVVGRLFRDETTNGTKSEIVLLVTPHIVRNISRPDTVQPLFPSGTDAAPGAAPLVLGGQVSLSAGTGSGVVTAPAVSPSSGGPVSLTVMVPSEVKVGQEFALTLGMPMGVEGSTANVQVTYDPSVLKPLGGAAPPPDSLKAPDMAQIPLEVAAPLAAGMPVKPVQLRFQVIAPAATQTEIGLLVTQSNRPVNVPATLSLSVVKP
jgi:general secretion pathway protein D